MKTQAMVWLAAAVLQEEGHDTFGQTRLVRRVVALFPEVDYGTVAQYVATNVNTSGPLVYSFAYLVKVERGQYRLTLPTDPNPLGKRRWPDENEIDPEFVQLWKRWLDWQQDSPAIESAPALVEEVEEDPSVHFTQSSYREAMLEHLLIGELMRHLWPKRRLEVCKPQVDAAGYDLLLQCDGILRHVQLKTSTLNATRASVNLHVELWKRTGGCVIWTRFDPETLALKEFWWLGGPDRPLPASEGLEMAKHTKGNAEGVKGYRPSLRVVPKGQFKRLGSVAELVEHLFGV